MDWHSYFMHNRENLMPIEWDSMYRLTREEVSIILKSLQQFQLGESSEGKHFMARAEQYVQRSGDTEYLPALKLFIQEEQRHSATLGRFMQQQDLPLVTQDSVDSVFRFLRGLIDLEVMIFILLMAEIFAMTYYKALHEATQAPVLRQICRQILRDEVKHLMFQSEALSKTRRRRSSFGMFVTKMVQRFMFTGTILVVWTQHHKVYQAGGFTFGKYWQKCWYYFLHTFEPQTKKVMPFTQVSG
jgi:hypothetical protein